MRHGQGRLAATILGVWAASCAADSAPEALGVEVGAADLSLLLPDGSSLDSLKYRIARRGFEREDSLPLDKSKTIAFQIGGLPAAKDYALTLRGKTSDGVLCSAGPVPFDIMAKHTSSIRTSLECGDNDAKNAGGNARVEVDVVEGKTCGSVDGLTALPVAADVGSTIELHAYSSLPHARYEWSAKPDDDAFSHDDQSKTEFECKTEGKHTVTVTVTDKKSCKATDSVELTCSRVGGSTNPPATVDIAVTNVTASVYNDGRFEVTYIPRGSDNAPVLDESRLDVSIDITAPAGQTATVAGTVCREPMPGMGLSVGVIIDDSGSMSTSDPMLQRRDAVVAFIDKLRAGDEVLLTDYGASSGRDLVCASSGGTSCVPPTAAGFTSDTVKLKAAVSQIQAGGGTPLYTSCRDMVPLVASRSGRTQAILLLSDGEPGDSGQRTACLDAATKAMVPVFTVGLGPAAEGGTGSSPAAVMVLREISAMTKAGYGSAAMPALLAMLFTKIADVTTEGSCTTTGVLSNYQSLPKNTQLTGTLHVGGSAMGTFGFVTPP